MDEIILEPGRPRPRPRSRPGPFPPAVVGNYRTRLLSIKSTAAGAAPTTRAGFGAAPTGADGALGDARGFRVVVMLIVPACGEVQALSGAPGASPRKIVQAVADVCG